MSEQVHGLRAFHASPLGGMAARLVRARLAALWPEAGRLDVAGIGWARPYLKGLPSGPGRRLVLVPETLAPMDGAPAERTINRPGEAARADRALVEESRLPLPDRCLDGILLAHALEASPRPGLLLRECWRVLRDHGRLLVVVPNRLGNWALFEHTPFGQGRPFSPGQAERLLEAQMFRLARRDGALFQPPLPWRWAVGAAPLWERPGRWALGRFAGVLVLEAEKDAFAPIPAGAVSLRRRVVARAGAAPARRPHAARDSRLVS